LIEFRPKHCAVSFVYFVTFIQDCRGYWIHVHLFPGYNDLKLLPGFRAVHEFQIFPIV